MVPSLTLSIFHLQREVRAKHNPSQHRPACGTYGTAALEVGMNSSVCMSVVRVAHSHSLDPS